MPTALLKKALPRKFLSFNSLFQPFKIQSIVPVPLLHMVTIEATVAS